jgi:acyl-CoA synthetase (AMP-forming)/AMP-acid ligase II
MSVSDSPSLVDLLRQRARATRSQVAYTFLDDGGSAQTSLTYGELDERARAVAAHVQALAPAGTRALLLYPPGPEYVTAFFACLYAGVVAVPAYPPLQAPAVPRLEAMVVDAGVTVALTSAAILALAAPAMTRRPVLNALHWLTTDTLPVEPAAAAWQDPALTGSSLAFLQYTSGATADPRGVVLTHGGLLEHLALIAGQMGFTRDDVAVSWLPPYHDLGLIGGVLSPLHGGFPCVLMSPLSFLQRPLRWLAAIARHRATCTAAPNFAYELCVRKVSPLERVDLDLRSWTLAVSAGEPVRADTLDRFTDAFRSCGFRREVFYPCYGLAEATLVVSGGTRSAPPVVTTIRRAPLEHRRVVRSREAPGTARLVGCGPSLRGQQILIVDPESRRACEPDRIGEIWVAGPSVAQGYWNRPEDTAITFGARLADGRGPFLRTGDLGFVDGGELVVTGRIKDLVVIRGLNHYPADLEATVERSHPALRPGCGAAFSIELDGDEHLVVLQEVRADAPASPADIITAIRHRVAGEHGLLVHAVVLLEPGSIRKTSSGKVQRPACRAAFLEGRLRLAAASPSGCRKAPAVAGPVDGR